MKSMSGKRYSQDQILGVLKEIDGGASMASVAPEYGGGEIYFDDVLIRKDGLFVLSELMALNPDQLG
jgi:hypothetical protein